VRAAGKVVVEVLRNADVFSSKQVVYALERRNPLIPHILTRPIRQVSYACRLFGHRVLDALSGESARSAPRSDRTICRQECGESSRSLPCEAVEIFMRPPLRVARRSGGRGNDRLGAFILSRGLMRGGNKTSLRRRRGNSWRAGWTIPRRARGQSELHHDVAAG